jgi:hypothetical protein
MSDETGSFQCSNCHRTITYPKSDPNNQSGHAGWCGGPEPGKSPERRD